jgi:hypothetical protein
VEIWRSQLGGVSNLATKKTVKTAAPKSKTPKPQEKLVITRKDNDWYQDAFKRFSISQNRTDLRRDQLGNLRPPMR